MIEDKIIRISQSSIFASIVGRYANVWQVSGFLLQKPKLIKHDKFNITSCVFIVHQIGVAQDGHLIDISFNLLTFKKELIDKLMSLQHCCFISGLAQMSFNKKIKQLTGKVYDMDITCEMLEEDLEESI